MNRSYVCTSNADDKFGPHVVGCRDNFDFTLLFEQSILSLAPSALLVLISVPRIVQLRRRTIKIVPTQLRYCKNLAILCSGCLRLALLVLWTTWPRAKTRVSIAAAFLSFTAILILALLSNLEHTRTIRPSVIVNTYLFFTILLDLAQIRTLWLIPGDQKLASVFTAGTASNMVHLVFESVEKRSFLKSPYNDYPPEALCGIFSRSIFWWLNGLFLRGYRRILNLGDLFQTDDELSSHKLQLCMRSAWQGHRKHKKHALLRATLSAFKLPLSKVIFPRLCVSALKFCQPLLINRAVSLISESRTQANRNDGYGLIGATALIYFGLAIGNAKYRHKNYRSVTMIRGGLISLISDVTLLLDAGLSKDSAAVTLMSTDVDRIVSGLEYSDFIWASPIEIAVALYLLSREIGLPCLMPLAISLGSAAAGYFVGNAAASAQKNWIDAVQKRVGNTASMLGSMKAVKMMGLSRRFSDRIQKLKIDELKQSNKFRRITTARNAVSNFSSIMAPALTFAVYTAVYLHSSNRPFNPATAFTSLSIIALLSQSVQWWVIALFSFQASLGCYERIQKYLLSETRQDARSCTTLSEDLSESENEKTYSFLNPEKTAPGIISKTMRSTDDYAISVIGGRSGYCDGELPVIKDCDLRIRPSTLTMVIGPVGCGKSTLLKSLLGEMPFTTGEVRILTREIGYCAQEPWLPNNTIKQSITCFRRFENGLYETVVRACALDEDIRQLPAGDDTTVGSKGASLSGGQKQRLALARALYSRNRLLLLDDVLSGLDGKTEQAVFHRVLGPQGMCRKYDVTVILATHAVKYLPFADHVVVLNANGTIAEQGAPKEVGSRHLLTDGALKHDEGVDKEGSVSEEETPKRGKTTAQDNQAANTRLAGDLRIYAYYASAVGWILAFYLVTQATTTFLMRFPDVWLRWWSAAEVSHVGQGTRFYLGIYCMFAGLALCSMVIGILTLFTGVMPRSSARLHRRLLDTVMSAPYPFLAVTDSGVILNRFSQDMSLIDMQLPTALLQTADGFMFCIAQTILITTSSKFVATLIPAAIVVLYLIQRFYLRTSRQIRLLDLETKSPMYTHFLETLSGLHTIRAFNWQSTWDETSRELLDRSQRPVYLLYCIQRWLGLALDGMVAISAIVIITLATQLNQSASSVGGALGVALVNLLNLSNMLSYLIRAWTELETSIGAVLRVRDFESSTRSENNASNDLNEPPTDWPHQGAIEFRNVDATYDISTPTSAPRAAPDLVLKSIALSVPASSHIGICGRTGSGKSSLLLTLFQMVEITAGNITIDGIDISSIPRSTLRERILCIPQSPELFPGSVRENLDPLGQCEDENIIGVLEAVGLWNVIKARGGLSTEGSTPLSAGERQIFALAYALLRRQSLRRTGGILVLDEFSASVDVETERKILDIVKETFKGWTVLSVAHRLETIKDCDLVVVMNAGRIEEVGEPEVLETVHGGIWNRMVGMARRVEPTEGEGKKENVDEIEVAKT